ncbi:hypothetical protein C5H14_01890 [Xylella fastidiosa]|nr:hypothetical protein C5H14_01890 [Xylella fastidiosa]
MIFDSFLSRFSSIYDFIGIIFFCTGMGESHVIASITQCELLIVRVAFIRSGSVLRSTLVMRDA